MELPGRNFQSSLLYKYGYQGQFAEKDEETGLNQFELRLYDSRINRSLSTDPYNQYHSPYIGMGNNWVNLVDPSGGSTEDHFLGAEGHIYDKNLSQSEGEAMGLIWLGSNDAKAADLNLSLSNLGFNGRIIDMWAQTDKFFSVDMTPEEQAQGVMDIFRAGAESAETILFLAAFFPESKIVQAYAAYSGTTALTLGASSTAVLGKSYVPIRNVIVKMSNNSGLLAKLNRASKGTWVKVYEAGIRNGKNVEIHYFRNMKTGKVFDVKQKYAYWKQK